MTASVALSHARPAQRINTPKSSFSPTASHSTLTLAFLDLSNVTTSAQHLSAVRLGWATDYPDAVARNLVDYRLRLNFTALRDISAGPDGRALLFGSRPAGQVRAPWELPAGQAGWITTVRTRRPDGREKGVDTGIAAAMIDESWYPNTDPANIKIILLAGDGDYVPPLERLAARGIHVTVMAFSPATARDLHGIAAKVVFMDPWLESISFRRPTQPN